ncbi:hypothetical protein JCM17478_22520 [Thermopirellula anaerolimosa]
MRLRGGSVQLILLIVGIGCSVWATGCRRPATESGTANRAPKASETVASEQKAPSTSQKTDSEANGEKAPPSESSRRGGRDAAGKSMGEDGAKSGSGGASGNETGGAVPGSLGARGTSGTGAQGGTSPDSASRSMPGRNAAVQRARDALARSASGDAREGYRELFEAWQGLQGFTENDDESAALAARLLKEMERRGASLDQAQMPDDDKPLIAE